MFMDCKNKNRKRENYYFSLENFELKKQNIPKSSAKCLTMNKMGLKFDHILKNEDYIKYIR